MDLDGETRVCPPNKSVPTSDVEQCVCVTSTDVSLQTAGVPVVTVNVE